MCIRDRENSEDVTDVAATDGFLGLLSFIFLQDNRWKFYINGLGITLLVSLMSVIVGILIGLVVAPVSYTHLGSCLQ